MIKKVSNPIFSVNYAANVSVQTTNWFQHKQKCERWKAAPNTCVQKQQIQSSEDQFFSTVYETLQERHYSLLQTQLKNLQ